MMVGFVIPIKPRRFSRNWKFENALLNRTLGSILKQTASNYKIFIVYTDRPEVCWNDYRLHWVSFDYPFCLSDEIADYDSFVKNWYNPDYASKMFDKGRKFTLGCLNAKRHGCRYVMAVDSDDLISNKIVSYVNLLPVNSPGLILKKGYMYVDGTSWLLKKRILTILTEQLT